MSKIEQLKEEVERWNRRPSKERDYKSAFEELKSRFPELRLTSKKKMQGKEIPHVVEARGNRAYYLRKERRKSFNWMKSWRSMRK